MRAKLSPVIPLLWFTTALVLAGITGLPAQAAELKFEAQLVWATDDAKPPEGKKYIPVAPEVGQKLKKLLKWKNYFEVRRSNFSINPGTANKVAISEKCQLDVKDLGAANVEVVLIGKGKEVARQKQALPKGETLVLGGNAPNETAWLVILKRVE